MTISGTVTNSNDVFATSGDNITLTGDNCKLGTGIGQTTLNGTIAFRTVSSSTTTRSFIIGFNNLTMIYDTSILTSPSLELTMTQQGGYQFGYFNAAQSTSLSTGTFTMVSGGITRTRSVNNLQEVFRDENYALNGSYSYQNYDRQYSINGLMSYVKNGVTLGAGTYTTITPFTTSNYSSSYPSSGQATLKGQKGTLRITAQSDATNVFIELDANDDGTYESSSTMTWTQLLASI